MVKLYFFFTAIQTGPKKKKKKDLLITELLGLSRDCYFEQRNKDFLLKKQNIFKNISSNQSHN